MNASIMTGDGEKTPAHYEIDEATGSAYYAVAHDEHAPELIQVPLSADGSPVWEQEPGPYFGGGAVDFARGVGDADQERMRAMLTRLLALD